MVWRSGARTHRALEVMIRILVLVLRAMKAIEGVSAWGSLDVLVNLKISLSL